MKHYSEKLLTGKNVSIIVYTNESSTLDGYQLKIISFMLLGLVIIGIFGNILNLIILRRRKFKDQSTYKYLFYLSIIDILILLTCTTYAFLKYEFNLELRLYSEIFCRLHTFTVYFLTHLSSILLMVVSIDRALIIHNKNIKSFIFRIIISIYKKLIKNNQYLINRKRKSFYVEKVVLLIIFVIFLLNFHFLIFLHLINPVHFYVEKGDFLNMSMIMNNDEFVFRTLNQNISLTYYLLEYNQNNDADYPIVLQYSICFPFQNTYYFKFLTEIWIWIDMCIFCIIPFIFMTCCSILIFRKISKSSKKSMGELKALSSNSKINIDNLKEGKKEIDKCCICYWLQISIFYLVYYHIHMYL